MRERKLPVFETTGIIDEALLKEIQKYVLAPRQKILLVVFICIGVFCAVIGVLNRDWVLISLGILDVAVFVIESIWLRRRAIKMTLARTMENVGKPYMEYSSSFLPEGVQIHNHGNHAQTVLSYTVFWKLHETTHLYLLFTKTWQFVPIFKECLPPDAAQELVAFLKGQPTQIKWKTPIP